MSSALAAAARRAPSLARSFHAGRPSMSATGSYEDYLHAPRMYSIEKMPNREFKVALGVGSVLFGGIGIGMFAIWFQQQKTKSA